MYKFSNFVSETSVEVILVSDKHNDIDRQTRKEMKAEKYQNVKNS